ncbi:MAG: hypothetical protein R2822_13835 [Spirosomataceae bacterium]
MGLKVERTQFVPDGKEAVVVEYKLLNTTPQTKKVSFTFNAVSDLRPTWLGERTNMTDAPDIATYNETARCWTIKDSLNEWHVAFGSSLKPVAYQKIIRIAITNPLAKEPTPL